VKEAVAVLEPTGSAVHEMLAPFLDELEAPVPSACAGTAAAAVAAMSAAIIVMVGRGSPDWAAGAGVAAQARTLRSRLAELGAQDVEAFARVLEFLSEAGELSREQRDFQLGRRLMTAAEVPLRIAEAAADVSELAALAATEGKPALRPDAAAAATLAEAAVRASAHLVDINLATVPGDRRSTQAAALAAAAEAARARALGAA
jgi:formiminotetrahydrofolate cyclodeaminase